MIKRLILVLLFAILISSFPESSSAEIYLGIGPFDNLSDLKSKFPNRRNVGQIYFTEPRGTPSGLPLTQDIPA